MPVILRLWHSALELLLIPHILRQFVGLLFYFFKTDNESRGKRRTFNYTIVEFYRQHATRPVAFEFSANIRWPSVNDPPEGHAVAFAPRPSTNPTNPAYGRIFSFVRSLLWYDLRVRTSVQKIPYKQNSNVSKHIDSITVRRSDIYLFVMISVRDLL